MTEDTLRTASLDVFNAWRAKLAHAPDPSDEVQLLAALEKKTEGQSEAEVWELTFRRVAPSAADSESRFILRLHTGPDGNTIAERERTVVRMLCSTGSDYFSSNLLEGTQFTAMVAYRHVNDEINAAAEPLGIVVRRTLLAPDDSFNEMVTSISRLASGVTSAYRHIAGDVRVISGAQYYNRFRSRLLPDLIIDARRRTITVEESSIEISRDDGSAAPRNREKILLQDTAVFTKRVSDGTLEPGWTQLKMWFVKRDHHIPSQLKFQSEGIRIWLYVNETDVSLDGLSTERPYILLLNTRDRVVFTPFEQLRAAGFSGDACFLPEEFEGYCEQIDRVHVVERHTDLHCGNLLCANGLTKVIDLGSVDRDLSPVSRARLEISIWYRALGQIELTTDEIMQVLSHLEVPETAQITSLLSKIGQTCGTQC